MQHEELLTQQDFMATLETERPAVIITSDAALAELASSSHSSVVVVTPPSSEIIAGIGARKLLAGETVSVEALTPTICAGRTLKSSSKETAEHDSRKDCRRKLQWSRVGVSAVRVRPAQAGDLPRLVEIASHSVTAAQWNQAEYQKLFDPTQHYLPAWLSPGLPS